MDDKYTKQGMSGGLMTTSIGRKASSALGLNSSKESKGKESKKHEGDHVKRKPDQSQPPGGAAAPRK